MYDEFPVITPQNRERANFLDAAVRINVLWPTE